GPLCLGRGPVRSGGADDRERACATAGGECVAALPGAARRAAPGGGGAGLRARALRRRTRPPAWRAALDREEVGGTQPDCVAGVHGMTPDPDDRTLAGEYALGLLEGEAGAVAERRLATDAAFAREVADWQQRFSAFDDIAEAEPPGEALWHRIEAGV